MRYTESQYALLEKIEPGVLWTTFTDEELNTYHYLAQEGLCCPREDLRPDLITLSQLGLRVLSAHRDDLKHSQQIAKDRAEKKREKKQDRAFEIFLVLFGFILGLISEHFVSVISFLVLAIEKTNAFFSSLFH